MCIRDRVRTGAETPTAAAPWVEKGKPANFFVYYEFDEDESKHALALEERYGRREAAGAPNAWVLLDEL